MNFLQSIVLAVVQGATEFIPVSSSGHLVLAREFMGWSDEGGVFIDVILHAASLLAVLIYFREDWLRLVRSFLVRKAGGDKEGQSLLWLLIVATIPVALIAPFAEEQLGLVRNSHAVGIIMIATGGWFVFCEWLRRATRDRVDYMTAAVMGVVQVVALLPGASRSGLTTGSGLLCGQQRERAARFSFQMAVPAILGAVIFEAHELIKHPIEIPVLSVLVGFLVCFAVSLASIHFCLRLFRRHSLIGFAIYLGIMGTTLLLFR